MSAMSSKPRCSAMEIVCSCPVAAKGEATKISELARAQSRVTHAAPECLDAAEVLARVLTTGIEGRGYAALQAGIDAKAESKVSAVAEGSWRGKARNDIRSSGYVVDTLEAGLWLVAESGPSRRRS